MPTLSTQQLKDIKLLMKDVAQQHCDAINRVPQRLSGYELTALEHCLKGNLLREIIIKFAYAKKLLLRSQGGSFLKSAQLLCTHATLPLIPTLSDTTGLAEFEPYLAPQVYQSYTQALDQLGHEVHWHSLTESSLGVFTEYLTGFHVRRITDLSFALWVARDTLRWLSITELKRILTRRPTIARLQARLGLSPKQAQYALKPSHSSVRKLSILKTILEQKGQSLEEIEDCLAYLKPILNLVVISKQDMPYLAISGELIWEEGSHRKLRGVHYTPYQIAQDAVKSLLHKRHPQASISHPQTLKMLSATRVCDPAVGGGVFLVEYVRVLLSMYRYQRTLEVNTLKQIIISQSLFGIDIDPYAVEITRVSLWLLASPDQPIDALNQHIICGDSLGSKLTDSLWKGCLHEGFDFVFCNPPYLNGIERSKKRTQQLKSKLKNNYPHSAVGTYDSSELFWERCCQILAPQGYYALIVPTVQLAHEGSFKRWLHQHWRATNLKLYSLQSFREAKVRTVLAIGQQGTSKEVILESDDPQVPIQGSSLVHWEQNNYNWFMLFSRVSAPLGTLNLERHKKKLSDDFTVYSGCATGIAYELRNCLIDQQDESGSGPKLITTGLIERYQHVWGLTLTRYLKADYLYPRWPKSPPFKGIGLALERQQTPKVLVAGLSAVLESFCDPSGLCAGVVQTWVIRPKQPLSFEAQVSYCDLLCVYLNSAALSYHFVERYGAAAMSGRQMTIKKQALLDLPLPPLSSATELQKMLDISLPYLESLHLELLDRLQHNQNLDQHLSNLSQLERDSLKVFTCRMLSKTPSQQSIYRLLDELSHRLVSASYGCLGSPIITWWRQRTRQI